MTQSHYSIMAEGVAISRAVHQLHDAEPLLFRDPLATKIIGAAGHRRLRDNLAMYSTRGLLCARTTVTIRSRLADLQNRELTSVDYRGSWHRVTPWLPWMLMGQAPGEVFCVCHMGSTRNLEEIFPPALLDYAARHHAKFFTAPERWTDEPSLPGLEQYARTQKPMPVR